MQGRLYYYKDRITKDMDEADALVDGIREAVLSYIERTGYRPTTVYVLESEWVFEDNELGVPGGYDVKVTRLSKGCQPHHFFLSHEVDRKPRRTNKVIRRPVL